MWSFDQWRWQRILKHGAIDDVLWEAVWERLPLLHGLSVAEIERLRSLAVLFLHDKVIEPVQGFELGDEQRLQIALLACLPILNLGFEWYDGWVEVVVYRGEFIKADDVVDEAGLVQHHQDVLSGEAWLHGPVILSWANIVEAGEGHGHNVVIHEMAHKLDMLNGAANGYPPLHPEMKHQAWSDAFSAAFADLTHRIERGEHSDFNSYAVTNPAEFFAVFSEYFFDAPWLLLRHYPEVYHQLSLFYRQNPVNRYPASAL